MKSLYYEHNFGPLNVHNKNLTVVSLLVIQFVCLFIYLLSPDRVLLERIFRGMGTESIVSGNLLFPGNGCLTSECRLLANIIILSS